jgi:hypothetical protein
MNTPQVPPLSAVEESRLEDRLAELRSASATLEAPPALEATLRRAFREKARPSSRPRLWWMPPFALVATVAAVTWMARGPLDVRVPVAAPVAASLDDAGPFLALRPLDRIALEPSATVVRTEFPRAFLAQLGLPVSPERAGEPVRAELLYSSDGEALAVRLLDSNGKETP